VGTLRRTGLPTLLTFLACRPVAGPTAHATAGDQPLMQVAGEQRDAVGAGVVPEEMAGHADLAAAAGAEHVLIEPGPVLDRIKAGGLQTGEGDRHHGSPCGRTPVLAWGASAPADQVVSSPGRNRRDTTFIAPVPRSGFGSSPGHRHHPAAGGVGAHHQVELHQPEAQSPRRLQGVLAEAALAPWNPATSAATNTAWLCITDWLCFTHAAWASSSEFQPTSKTALVQFSLSADISA